MDRVFSDLINVLQPESNGGVITAKGIVTRVEPTRISIGGEEVDNFFTNKEIIPEEGDKVLCLIDGEDIYIICKVG